MSVKNCLLVFRNKKINDFENPNNLVDYFASESIYFNLVSYCAYDDSEEIVRSIKQCKNTFDNLIILCPAVMETSVKEFTEKLFEGSFDNFGIMVAEKINVFILKSDEAGRLDKKDITDFFAKKYGLSFDRAYIKTVGAATDEINAAVSKAKALSPECDFNVSGRFSDCTVEFVYPNNLSKNLYDGVFRILLENLNEYVYSMENVSLAERLFQLLKLRRMKISLAESFTGGGIAKRLVEVPGISEVYVEGLNTYSNQSKMNRLGVSELTLKQFGAVSEETAYQMADGLLRTGDCDLALSTTGIAGPKSDSTLKPVGLLYIGVGTAESVSVYKYELKGSREQITETAINLALFLAFKKIK